MTQLEEAVARAVCPHCGAEPGQPCDSRFAGGVHGARVNVICLPTLDELAATEKLRRGFEALVSIRPQF